MTDTYKPIRDFALGVIAQRDADVAAHGRAGATNAIERAAVAHELLILLDGLPESEPEPAPESWVVIATGDSSDVVRRLRVPGGWLYQVKLSNDSTNWMADHPDYYHHGWHPPVFVPEPRS